MPATQESRLKELRQNTSPNRIPKERTVQINNLIDQNVSIKRVRSTNATPKDVVLAKNSF